MDRKLALLILIGAMALRVAAGIWWQQRLPEGQQFAFPDSHAYWELARRVANGEAYAMNPDRRVFRTPGYPVLLSSLHLLGSGEPPVAWARILNAVLGTTAVGAVMVLTWLLFDGRTSLVAGALAAVYPSAISMSTFVLAEAPFCPLMILHLILWVTAWRSHDRRRQISWALVGGLAAGLATLMRPSWMLFTPFALVVGIVGAFLVGSRLKANCEESPDEGDRPPKAGLVRGTAAQAVLHAQIGLGMIIGLSVAMSPWWIRNWQITGQFVPTTLQVGESLYDGLSPRATGASEMSFVDRFRRELREADEADASPDDGRRNFEQRLDERMRRAAIHWAREHPVRVAELAIVKFRRMWNIWPNEASLRSPLMGLVLCSAYLPVLLLALYGSWRFLRCGWPYVLCFLPAVYFTCLHMIFVGSIRYRQPAMLPLIAIAAGALCDVVRRAMKGTSKV